MTLRLVAAMAVLASAAIHLTLWFQGMRDVHVIGNAFLLNIIGGLVISILLVRWQQHWVPGALAACFGLLTLSAFTLASTVGLFGDHERWGGFYVFGAAGSEILALLVGLTIVLEDPEQRPAPAPVRPGGAHVRVSR